VRLSPPITILAIVAAAMVGLGWSNQGSLTRDREVSCVIALDYLKFKLAEAKNQAFVIDYIEPSITSASMEASRNAATPEMRKHPDFALGDRQVELGRLSPIKACPNVAHWLHQNGVERVSSIEDTLAASAQALFEKGKLSYVGLSMPAIDSERGIAAFSSTTPYRQYLIRYVRGADRAWHMEYDAGGAIY